MGTQMPSILRSSALVGIVSALFVVVVRLPAQELYFPPLTGGQWETLDPAVLGWDTQQIDSLYNFLERKNTKAFLLLKDGRIVLEKYFGSFRRDSLWYWASAGKVLTAALVGIAQQEKALSIQDATTHWLGQGWTSAPPDKEALITIRHQLTMTTGLDDSVSDPYCTQSQCLVYKADAGTRWAYHNAPYTLLESVLESATGRTLNQYFFVKIRDRIGMDGAFFKVGFNNVYVSTARSMARFGLLILNKGWWKQTPILTDTAYFNEMVNTSQSLNLSYGYLWWLNGKSSFMVPGSQLRFPGPLIPSAPADMIAALGKDGQFLNIVPSLNLIMVRMGQAPDTSQVPAFLNIQIWEYLARIFQHSSSVAEDGGNAVRLDQNFPNPFATTTTIRLLLAQSEHTSLKVFDLLGREIATLIDRELEPGEHVVVFSGSGLPPGVYECVLRSGTCVITRSMIVLR